MWPWETVATLPSARQGKRALRRPRGRRRAEAPWRPPAYSSLVKMKEKKLSIRRTQSSPRQRDHTKFLAYTLAVVKIPFKIPVSALCSGSPTESYQLLPVTLLPSKKSPKFVHDFLSYLADRQTHKGKKQPL